MYDANNFGRAAGDTIIASAKFFHLCVYMAEEFTDLNICWCVF